MGSVRLVGGVNAAMQVRNVARRLERYTRDYGFTLNELEALQVDITAAESRLLNGLYSGARSSGPRVPDRTEELFGDVGFYWSAGQVWRGLLMALNVGASGRVAEVGCGVVPKVGGALHYGGFEGSLDLVDISEETLQLASRWLTLLGCRFTYRARRAQLFDLDEGGYDGIFANHVIDDLLLHERCVRKGYALQDLYANGARYIEEWRGILEDTSWVPAFVDELVDRVVSALAPSGVVIMSDYESHSHRDLGLGDVTRLVRDARNRLRMGFLRREMRSLEAHVPLHLRSDRFEVRRGDVLAFQKRGDRHE